MRLFCNFLSKLPQNFFAGVFVTSTVAHMKLRIEILRMSSNIYILRFAGLDFFILLWHFPIFGVSKWCASLNFKFRNGWEEFLIFHFGSGVNLFLFHCMFEHCFLFDSPCGAVNSHKRSDEACVWPKWVSCIFFQCKYDSNSGLHVFSIV